MSGPATDLQLSPDGQLLALAFGTRVRLLRRDGGEQAAVDADAPVLGVAFSPDGASIALACEDGSLRLADTRTGASLSRGESEHGGLVSVAWAPDGSKLAAGHFEPWIGIFDAGTAERVELLDPDVFDDEGRTSTAFLADGQLLSTALDNLVIWHPRRKRLPAGGGVHLIDLDVAGHRAVGLSQLEGAAALHVWDVAARGKPVSWSVPGRCRRVRWLPGAATVAVAGATGVTAWSAEGPGDPAFEGEQLVAALAVASDPAVLYGAGDDGTLLAWNAATGERR